MAQKSSDEKRVFFLMIEWTLEFLFPKQSTQILDKFQNKADLPVRILALDCEFIRTVHRADSLARLTVCERSTNDNWDILVKQPKGGICDLRTPITGLTDDSFCTGNCAELQSVKKKLLNLITDRKHFVVLVGHDFRRDLYVLGLREEISKLGVGLIDTSVIFYYDLEGSQHRKPALKDLYEMLCNGTLRGPNDVHDSIKDCEATLALFEKGLKFVREYRQRIPVKPLDSVVQRWAPQYVFEVTGVNIRTSEASLSNSQLFGQFGDIKRIRFIYRSTKQPNNAKKFTGKCIVFYQSYVVLDPMEVIMTLNGRMVDQHMIHVEFSSKSKKPEYYNQQNMAPQYYDQQNMAPQYYDHHHHQRHNQAQHHYRNHYFRQHYPHHRQHHHQQQHHHHNMRPMHQVGFDRHQKRQAYYEERYGFGFDKINWDNRLGLDRNKQGRVVYPLQSYY